jgi:hypothetical protein
VVRFRPVHYVPPRRVQSDLSALQRNLLQVLGRTGRPHFLKLWSRSKKRQHSVPYRRIFRPFGN